MSFAPGNRQITRLCDVASDAVLSSTQTTVCELISDIGRESFRAFHHTCGAGKEVLWEYWQKVQLTHDVVAQAPFRPEANHWNDMQRTPLVGMTTLFSQVAMGCLSAEKSWLWKILMKTHLFLLRSLWWLYHHLAMLIPLAKMTLMKMFQLFRPH